MIIAFAGQMHVGKDTCADYLVKKYGYKKVGFADPFKEASKAIFGWDDRHLYGDLKEKTDPYWKIIPRDFFQLMGTEIGQYFLPGRLEGFLWVGRKIWIYRFLKDYDKNVNYAICDMRFPHEADTLRDNLNDGEIIVVGIRRPFLNTADAHASETECSFLRSDYDIHNDKTIKDLYLNLDNLMKRIADEKYDCV